MGDKTGISWCDATWNPVRGCSKISPGCTHCYAERVAVRFSGPGQPYEGLADRERGRWTGEVRLVPEHLADPLRWRRPRRIFVNSMSDLFHERLTNEEIAAVFGVMAAAPQHTFQVLTKRAKRMREWFEWLREDADDADLEDALAPYAGNELGDGSDEDQQRQFERIRGMIEDANARVGADGGTVWNMRWPLPNVWLGVSIENQEAADERIPELLATPAAVRFLSCEPMIGKVDLSRWLQLGRCRSRGGGCEYDGTTFRCGLPIGHDDSHHALTPSGSPWFGVVGELHWIIVGCESGPGARTCEVAWLRALRDQCASASVPFFLKQAEFAGADGIADVVTSGDGSKRKAGGVIELPYLDGVQHAAFPVPR